MLYCLYPVTADKPLPSTSTEKHSSKFINPVSQYVKVQLSVEPTDMRCSGELARLDETALFDRNDKVVADLLHIETVFAAETVVKRVGPLVGMLFGFIPTVKRADLLQPSFFCTAAERFDDDVVLRVHDMAQERLLLLDIR